MKRLSSSFKKKKSIIKDDDDDESCNKCYALRVVFKRRDLKKNVSCVFVRKKGVVLFLILF